MSQKLHHACLFADGPAVMVCEKRAPQAGDFRCAEVVEQFSPSAASPSSLSESKRWPYEPGNPN